MSNKVYLCSRYPELAIRSAGKVAVFESGRFETDKPSLQKLVESNDWYGTWIKEAEGEPVVNEAKAAEPVKEKAVFGGVKSKKGKDDD